METKHVPAYVTPVWQAGARWTLWLILVKHTQPFQTFTGESIYCLHLIVYFPCFALGDHGDGTGSRRTPKHHLHLPGASQAQALLLGKYGQYREGFGVKSWAEQIRRSSKQEPHGAVMEPSTSRKQAGSDSFSRTGKPARGVTGTVSYRFLFRDQLPC